MPDVVKVVNQSQIVKIVQGGPKGDPGPQGIPGSGAMTYQHDQVAPSTTWIAVHNLGTFPNVTTVDTAGTQIHGQVVYDSSNQVTITFAIPVTGKAYFT